MSAPLRRIRARLEFSGEGFCGWQLQAEGQESQQPSIQGVMEAALSTVLHRKDQRFLVQGCGRTDAGVHAEEFYAHFDLEPERAGDLEKFRHKLNCVLPEGVVITGLREQAGFHAADDVTSKTYEYRLLLRRAKPVLARGRCCWLPIEGFDAAQFDRVGVEQALRLLEGTHDFVAFAAANFTARTSVRTLTRCELVSRPYLDHPEGGEWICLRFTGDGFLKQMVRNIVGTLIEIGQRRRTVESVQKLLGDGGQPAARTEAGPCAVPEGLFLVKVEYGSAG
ncbi:MAG: tRNA pseudouridine synthase A [Bdellovibrionales bacterium]|nr:tRNA pseudouridine synthase A [Bdellovibrionales bacterium]